MSLSVVYEGDTDLPVVKKLAAHAGFEITLPLDMAGKGNLDKHLGGYNDAAKGSPWFVLRDLDDDAPCAPGFLQSTAWQPQRWMCFRIAIREVEAWILADREAVAEYFEVPLNQVPSRPDALGDPTLELVNMCRRSKSARIRRAMVPRPGSDAQVGQQYENTVIDFATRAWDLQRACRNSPSLCRARDGLRALGQRWSAFTKQPATEG